MSLPNITLPDEYLLDPSGRDLERGNVYLMFSSECGIQEILFSSFKYEASFINSSIEGANNIDKYDRIDPLNRLSHLGIINGLGIYPAIDGHGYLDKILVIVLDQLSENNIIVIETTGLGKGSIVELTRYCLHLLKKFEDKLIVIVDFYYSNSKKVFIALVENDDLKEEILEYLPVALTKIRSEPIFKIKSR